MEVFLEQIGIQLNYTRELLIVALILGRTMPMVYLTPFLAGQIAPTEVKIGFGLLLAVLLWPAARGAVEGDIPFTAIIGSDIQRKGGIILSEGLSFFDFAQKFLIKTT